jgi:hypothetical protein
VRLKAVVSIEEDGTLRLQGGSLPLSRRRREVLEEALGMRV